MVPLSSPWGAGARMRLDVGAPTHVGDPKPQGTVRGGVAFGRRGPHSHDGVRARAEDSRGAPSPSPSEHSHL